MTDDAVLYCEFVVSCLFGILPGMCKIVLAFVATVIIFSLDV